MNSNLAIVYENAFLIANRMNRKNSLESFEEAVELQQFLVERYALGSHIDGRVDSVVSFYKTFQFSACTSSSMIRRIQRNLQYLQTNPKFRKIFIKLTHFSENNQG